jgi:hypothetical protein
MSPFFLHGIPFISDVLTLSGSTEPSDDQRFRDTLNGLSDHHWEIE